MPGPGKDLLDANEVLRRVDTGRKRLGGDGDDDGVAVLEGLGAMRYAVQVAHPHFAVLHGIDAGTVDAGTSDEVSLTLAPMVACVLRPPSPLSVRASTLDLMGVPTPATRSSRLAVAEARRPAFERE